MAPLRLMGAGKPYRQMRTAPMMSQTNPILLTRFEVVMCVVRPNAMVSLQHRKLPPQHLHHIINLSLPCLPAEAEADGPAGESQLNSHCWRIRGTIGCPQCSCDRLTVM